MSSMYCKAEDFGYFFKDEPRALSVYDSLSFSDNLGHTIEGQAGLVLKTLMDEVRHLHRVIRARKISDKTDTFAGSATS